MASVSVYLKNGDMLAVGATLEQAVAIYQALLSEAENDFIDLGTVANEAPRLAVRISEVQSLFLNPFDTDTVFVHTSAARHVELQIALQGKMNPVTTPSGGNPEPPAT